MPIPRRTFLASLAPLAANADTDRYGGWTKVKLRATGWFRTDRVRGRHVLVTPDGHPYVALGANHVGAYLRDPAQSGPLLARFEGDRGKAEQAIHQAMLDLGLNAGEAYAPLLPYLRDRLPRIENLEFPQRKKFEFDVFDPAWQAELHDTWVKQCREFARDPWVIGVTSVDLPVWNARRVDFFRKLPAAAPGRQRYERFLEANKGRTDDDAFLGIVARELYPQLRRAAKAGAPHHLFLGERFVLRQVPAPVLAAVGESVDVFCTQSLILSPQRPPEWQLFQPEGYRRDHEQTAKKPMIIIDWAAPFSLDTEYETDRGIVQNEATASEAAARFLEQALAEDYIVGVFKCQLAGAHGNDRWFPAGRMKRTYLRDDGTPFAVRTARTARAHREALAAIRRRIGIK